VAALEEEYESAADARHQLNYLQERLQGGEWETDESVLALRDKLADDLAQIDRERQRRQSEVDRSRELTDDARAAYMGKLRATVRAYGANIKRLGELAGIGVDVELPTLENDDAALAQAGLTLRFNFDQKGLMGMNDGEASGGQQVMKSLILLIGLMMDEANPPASCSSTTLRPPRHLQHRPGGRLPQGYRSAVSDHHAQHPQHQYSHHRN
jgi:chromosome segregation ATPase